jgi:hypothetical protein
MKIGLRCLLTYCNGQKLFFYATKLRYFTVRTIYFISFAATQQIN